ncbi:MAG: THUMP domain-containing protein [archaeon]
MILVRYGEIGLKGMNRVDFEKRLVGNIKDCLKKNRVVFKGVSRLRGRILVESEDECSCLARVFGISSFSSAVRCRLEMGSIKEVVRGIIAGDFSTFKISAKRLDKNFPMDSMQINRELGSFVQSVRDVRVRLNNPDLEIGIEIAQDGAFVFSGRTKGPGGLPAGSEGRVLCVLEDQNSVTAALRVMRRGCSVMLALKNKVDYSPIQEHAYGFRLRAGTGDIDTLAEQNHCQAVVVGQTIGGFSRLPYSKPVLRPMITLRTEGYVDINKKL